jgi:hypothetical protein
VTVPVHQTDLNLTFEETIQLGIHTRIIEVVTNIGMEHKQDRNHTGVRIKNYTKRYYQSLGIDVGSTFTNMKVST